MTSEEQQLQNVANRTDRLASLAKGVVGAAPFVGPILAEIVGEVIPNQRIDRIADFVRLLDERVSNIEQDRREERLCNPGAIDILEDAFTQAARATSQERLEHIANVVANGLAFEESKQTEAKRMLWLLGQLNDSEVVVLRSKLPQTRGEYENDSEFRDKHAGLLAPDVTHMGSTQDEFEEAALKESLRKHLLDLGLIRYRFSKPKRGELPEMDEKTGMMKASGTDVTRLGRMLLRYLDLIPDWYRG